MTFAKDQRVEIVNCLKLSGGQVWQDCKGSVRGVEAAKGRVTWYWVRIDGAEDLIPFKEGELSASREDDTA